MTRSKPITWLATAAVALRVSRLPPQATGL